MKICPECRERFEDAADQCPTDQVALLALGEGHARYGTVMADRFVVLDGLGEGGMGQVFKAFQLSTARTVALKLLIPEFADKEDVGKRFVREARVTAGLRSPHTVTVYDFGVLESGDLYIAMELLQGLPLDALLRKEGPFTPRRAARIVQQICLSLQEAHDNGLVHRDLKPQNIFVDRLPTGEDFAKVLDFGVAKVLDEQKGQLTKTGATVGTPAYMSPEQAVASPIGPGCDVYACGIMLFEMLTGILPFTADTAMQVMMKHIMEPPPSLASVGLVDGAYPALDELLDTCLKKEAAERFPTATALHGALAPFVTTEVPIAATFSGEQPGTLDASFAVSKTSSEPESNGALAHTVAGDSAASALAATMGGIETSAALGQTVHAEAVSAQGAPVSTAPSLVPSHAQAPTNRRARVMVGGLIVVGVLGALVVISGDRDAPKSVEKTASSVQTPSTAPSVTVTEGSSGARQPESIAARHDVQPPVTDDASAKDVTAEVRNTPAEPAEDTSAAASAPLPASLAPSKPQAMVPKQQVQPSTPSAPAEDAPKPKVAAAPPTNPVTPKPTSRATAKPTVRKAPSVRILSASLAGAAPKEASKGAMRKLKRRAKTCYAKTFGKGGPVVTLKVIIKPSGALGGVRLSGASAARFSACIKSGGVTFPSFSGGFAYATVKVGARP